MIPIQAQRVALLVHKMGGLGALMDEWSTRFADTPHRDTFHDWRTHPSFRGNLKSYLSLCAILDVDPIALIPESYFDGASFGDMMLMLAMNSIGGRGISAQDVFQTFGPLPNWPSAEDIKSYYGKDWNRRFFKNVGQSNSIFATVRLTFPSSEKPRLVHFAYRVEKAQRWRMYGTVSSWEKSNVLVNLYGPNQMEESSEVKEIYVQTRFGEGPCEFCLASIHDFEVELLSGVRSNVTLRFSS